VESLTERQRESWLAAVRRAWIVHAQVVRLPRAADRAYEAQRQRRPDSRQRHTEEDNKPVYELDGDRHFLLVAAAQLVKGSRAAHAGAATVDDPLDRSRPEDLSWGAGGLVLGRLGRADELREWLLDVYSRLTEQSPER
jgi:hypothetical protein